MPQLEEISAQLDRLARLEPSPFPIISLYLNLQADQHGRDRFEPFLRKELGERLRTYDVEGPPGAGLSNGSHNLPKRESLERDAEKILAYLSGVEPSANGVALFASSGSDLFEALQLAAPIPEHRLYVSSQPHLYPLARLFDEYPRYAVLLTDTNAARIFVIAANAVERRKQVEGMKTRRHKMGGWSQARYQRHNENVHLHHVKEVVDALARIVRDEGIESIIVSGDEVVVPMVKDHLPKDIAERVVDTISLNIHAAEREVLETTIASIRETDRLTDRERVDALLDDYRANGLAVVGLDATRQALDLGQVDELVIAAAPDTIATTAPAQDGPGERTAEEQVADELVAKARNTSARVRFIEDVSVAKSIGGVGAHLRFKM